MAKLNLDRNSATHNLLMAIVDYLNSNDFGTGSGTGDILADGTVPFTGAETFGGGIVVSDAKNVSIGTTTGTKIGTATAQKIGFWNKTPVIQQTTAVTASAFVANGSGIVDDSATWGGYTAGQIVAALKAIGILS